MPHAPKTSINSAKMQTKRSAWTPLHHAPSNSQLFEERRALLSKWFVHWTDGQKQTVLQDLIQSCSPDRLLLLSLSLSRRLPLQAVDFTCTLPRALCLYIFSFLDPRSLCRCAQVSWRWKNVVDLDQLWMWKCVRRGWYIDYCPSEFEQSVWKRHYIHTVQQLKSTAAQLSHSQPRSDSHDRGHEELCLEDALPSDPPAESRNSSTKRHKGTVRSSLSLPPWRDSDRRPRDIIRFNYLDNPHSVDQAWTAKTPKPDPICNNTRTAAPVDSSKLSAGSKTLTEAHYKLRKAKSLMFLSSNCRPLSQSESGLLSAPNPETLKKLLRHSQGNAAVRPSPIRSPVPTLSAKGLRTSQRSHQSVPSVPLLDVIQPWTVCPSDC